MLNPYKTPKSSDTSSRRQTSFARGVVAAFSLTIVGYALPILAFRGFDVLRYGEHAFQDGFFSDIINSHRRLTLDDLKMIGPSLGCALVGALSGFVNYTPQRFPGLLRTMMRVAIASIVGVVVMGFATMIFGLTTLSYTSDPHAPKRFAIFAVAPIGYAIWLLIHNLQSAAQDIDEPTKARADCSD